MNLRRSLPLLLALCCPLGARLAAQVPDSALRRVGAARRAGDVHIDGKLDEAAWAAAPVAGNFVQSWPNAGQPATERTEARVLYDDGAIYVGVRMYDAHPDSIAAQLARRDATGIFSDWVHIILDSYHDRRTGFRFSLNPRGVQKDVYHSNDQNEDLNWDAVWESATQVDSLGWTAEIRVPLSQLRFSGEEPANGRVWGFQVQRDIARKNERDSWSLWTRNDPGYVSRFGDLTGLVGVRPVRRLELLPYVSSRLTREPGDAANPFYSANDLGVSAGADFKVGITSGLTLTGTINPDFGQVEVDPAVVNLSAFETFFDEKRPFFVEGADVFSFGNVRTYNNYGFEQFFYSRRIGRQPQRALFGDSLLFVDAPGQTTILGAAKVSGKAGPWTMGVMNALTAEEHARFTTPTGRGSSVVEPLSDYLVGRVRREFRGGASVLGAMGTGTFRDLSADPAFPTLLRQRAFFAGVDGEHSWDRRRWTLSGYVSGSRVEGTPQVITTAQLSSSRYYQRPDADYLTLDPTRTSLGGYMAEAALQRSGPLYGSLGYKTVSPGFEINDLGFQGRTDYHAVTTLLGRRWDAPGSFYRDAGIFGFTYHTWNYGGESILQGGALGANLGLKNFWATGGRVGWRPWTDDDRLTRGGPLARAPGRWEGSAYLVSDTRKRISGEFDVSLVDRGVGGWDRSLFLALDYRPSSALRLRASPSLSKSFGSAQFVRAVNDTEARETFGTRYVFADIHQTTVAMETRVDWTFSPTLSLQLYAQPFVAAGDYANLKEFLTPGTYDFAVYGRDKGTLSQGASCANPTAPGGNSLIDPDGAGPAACFAVGSRDFNVRSLRGNAVLRWQYRPGSVLFFVWQQQRDGFDAVGDFDFGRDAGAVFRAPAHNVFVVKATYWLGR